MDAAQRSQFEQLMLPHLDAALNLARWLTQDAHAAEDVVQEAYVRAARYFKSFRGSDGRAWLLGVVRRAAFDWLSKRNLHSAESFNDDLHDCGDESSRPELLVIRSFEQARVRSALEELPPHLREAIILRELEGMSYSQIAAITEIPIGTVMSRISRGRHQLQLRLASCEERELT